MSTRQKHPLSHIKNRKIAQSREEGGFALRIFHRKSQKKKMPRYLIKCGCCNKSIEIYYDETSLEINGVMGSIQNWKEIFEPLLFEG